jgi:hypothetical protein
LWQATNQQKLLDFRLRSPLPPVEEPCPLSLPYGFFTCWPSLELKKKLPHSERSGFFILEGLEDWGLKRRFLYVK